MTNDLIGDWIQLPDAEPELVKAAQTFKKMFTGKLSAPVDSCPPFLGKEKHLLRAQLARIQHSTEIIPKGVLEKDEESGALKLAEEQPPTDTEAMKDLANWAHLPAGILKAGRCSHFVPPGIGEDGLEEFKAAADEKDKPFEELAAVAADLVLDRKTGKMYPAEEVPEDADRQDPWTTKIVGDTQLYKLGEGTVSYAVNVIESSRWPGAMTVAQGGQHCSIYIGDGVKSGDTVSLLPKLEEVADDPEEPAEQDEPQGKERKILADANIDAIKAAKDGNEELKEAANVTAEQLTEWIKALGEEFNDDEVKRMMAVAVKAEGGEEEEGKLNFEETLAAMATE